MVRSTQSPAPASHPTNQRSVPRASSHLLRCRRASVVTRLGHDGWPRAPCSQRHTSMADVRCRPGGQQRQPQLPQLQGRLQAPCSRCRFVVSSMLELRSRGKAREPRKVPFFHHQPTRPAPSFVAAPHPLVGPGQDFFRREGKFIEGKSVFSQANFLRNFFKICLDHDRTASASAPRPHSISFS